MTLPAWDIDRFPLTAEAAGKTPGQIAAEKWLAEHGEEMRPIEPGMLDRLTEEDYAHPDERYRNFGVPTGGGGIGGGGGMHYPSGGYNQEGRRYPGQEEHEPGSGGYYMPGITHPLDEEDEEVLPMSDVTYHVVTRPRNAIPGINAYDEHHYTRLENEYEHEPDDAWAEWESHPDNWNYNAENPGAEHEIVDVHPEEHHERWRNHMVDEDQKFERISQHGLERESPDVPGHTAYRHIDPHGGIHRVWHSYTNFINEGPNRDRVHGPGWRVSYHNPNLPNDQQVPWSFHDDDRSDSLGSALDRFDRNKRHADVEHSGTGLRAVENSYGNHYVSTRPDGSTQQMLRNNGYTDQPNWGVVHYPMNGSPHTLTEHGDDFAGALAQAKANLAKG